MDSPPVRHARSAAAAALLLCLLPGAAQAQYFGRNKVHYKDLKFQVLKTEHFDIYYYPEAREGIDIAARMAERWHTRLERILDHQLRGRQPLVLYASHVDFEQTNVLPGELSEGTGGVTESLRRRIILPLGGPLADTDHVLGHELVHAFQFDITTSPSMSTGETGAHRLPLWFIEGMAEYLSIGPVDAQTAMWLRDAARKEQLPEIDDLDNPKYFPYRWGHAFWAYVTGRWGDDVVRQMLVYGAAAGDPALAIQRVLGITTKELSKDWHAAIQAAYAPVFQTATPPSEAGISVIKGEERGGNLNIGPSISPDGKWIAFLSERSFLSIDLYVADASTGKVVRKLTSTGSDPHYSSIQFIHSAGGWDSASQRLAIATVTSGRPALAIFNAHSGKREQEVRITEVDEIFNPTWSPDGQSICFTGMSRGLTDLYIVNLASGSVRQLTRDAHAELQPAWSPDGKWIAFATDRFSSRLDVLEIGDYRIGLLDPANGKIEEVTGFPTGKHINPQWAPDSRSLYVIADRNGISNLYRIAVSGGGAAQLTNVITGLSGITGSSPALSVASQAGVAAFSVYDEGKYDIYTRSIEQQARADAPLLPASTAAATLPPFTRQGTEVAGLLANDREGLPPPADYPTEPYSPKLSLLALGQPTFAVGTSRFGTSIGGGISAYFGDMLGNHSLATVVQVNSGVTGSFSPKDTGALAQYVNQSHRWNWGVVGGQVPYLSGGIQQGFGTVNNEAAFIEQTIIFRQTERSVAGQVAYPFNRSHRIEFQAGASQLSFDQVVRTQAVSLNSGRLLLDETEETAVRDSLALGNTSAALVFDTSTFGATSPVQGQRYRLEAAPTFGTINFTSLLADYRRYFMPAPFYTIAARVLHYGRYGSGGQDDRLFPVYIGYPQLVRGYDVNSLDSRDCVSLTECPAFDRVIGSRALVGNLEFRFPLLRPFTGPSGSMYGPVPLEVGFFLDGGLAWNRGERPSFLGGDRDGVASAGIALRVNLFGFAVGEFDFTHPFQRQNRGMVFQFSLSPGF
jgi:Tol biopolymer transport system component